MSLKNISLLICVVLLPMLISCVYFKDKKSGELSEGLIPTDTLTMQKNNSDTSNISPMNEKETTGDIFPEPNKPPYFYASLGGDWVDISKYWSIHFFEVLSDTRCPTGVRCETSGMAKIKVQFRRLDAHNNHAYFDTLEIHGLNRFPMPNGAIKQNMLVPLTIKTTHTITNKEIGFIITLTDLRPYPAKEFHKQTEKIKYIGLFHIKELE